MPEWFDLCVVLTAGLHGLALRAGKAGVPVLWWLNDGRAQLSRLASLLPQRLAGNMTVCASGPHVQDALAACGLRWDVRLFPLCVEEGTDTGMPGLTVPHPPAPRPKGAPLVFTQIGAVRPRDGQELLAGAIRRLPIQLLLKTQFYFAGAEVDTACAGRLRDFCRAWPNAEYLGGQDAAALAALLEKTDVLVFPGADDPRTRLPGRWMLRGGPCLCADTSGAAGLLRGLPDALVFPSGDGDALLKCLTDAAGRADGPARLGRRGREACARTLSVSSFNRALSALAAQCLRQGSPKRSVANG